MLYYNVDKRNTDNSLPTTEQHEPRRTATV